MEESIVAIISNRDICIMDIHAHTIISEFMIKELNDSDINFLTWMKREAVEKILDSKFELTMKKMIKSNKNYRFLVKDQKHRRKIKSKFNRTNKKYHKEINKDYLLMTYVQNHGFLVNDFRIGTVFCINYKIEKFIASVEIVDFLDEKKNLVFMIGDKKGNLIVLRYQGKKYDFYFYENIHSALISEIRVN